MSMPGTQRKISCEHLGGGTSSIDGVPIFGELPIL
jgi:hypothetical protein